MIMRLFARFALAVLFLMGTVGFVAWLRPRRRARSWRCAIIMSKTTIPIRAYDGVTTAKLIEQLSWLQHEGYTGSFDRRSAGRARRAASLCRRKSVLLTFDDGYESFYTRVYPVLKAFHFPAVIGGGR